MQNWINIALGFDAAYTPHAAAVVASAVHFAPDAKFRFLMLHTGIVLPLRAEFDRLAPEAQFVWIEIGDDDVPPFAEKEHFTRATLFRLGLEKLAPADCQRVLYLDADLTVLRDLRDLWHSDLEGCPLGAVIESGTILYPSRDFAKTWQLPEQYPGYFNAGVLLIDLKQVRAEKLFSKCIEFLAKNGDRLPMNDQDALNWAAWGRWKPLDVVWNVQTLLALASRTPGVWEQHCLSGLSPAIVHFTGPEKPWQAGSYHPWAWLYWESLVRTPFAREVEGSYGMTAIERLKLKFRWMLRKPRSSTKLDTIPALDAARSSLNYLKEMRITRSGRAG
jgi:lipopolysaccharide biosynthesis glycosyltransferase